MTGIDLTIQKTELLLLVSALVAMLARKLNMPYSVGLVLAGVALSFLPFSLNIELTKDLIFNAFLPPLIFEAALYLKWKKLRRNMSVIVALATAGLLMSAFVTAAGMHYFTGWEWTTAAIFGILIAATDPVSVIAAFKESGVHGRLRLLVEAESLLNDGTAAVGFGVATAIASGQAVTLPEISALLATTIFGGILCGTLVAGAVLMMSGKTEDYLVEITFTVIAAYGSFLLAEHFHMSGVLSTLTAGLLIGNVGSLGSMSEHGREALVAFWEYVAFVANSFIFILIGMHETQHAFMALLFPALTAICLVTLGRAVAIYPCCALFSYSNLKVKMGHQHVLFWGGLRGALALALALGLPADLPHREEIITVVFAVVAFSVFVQGITIPPLLRKLGRSVVAKSHSIVNVTLNAQSLTTGSAEMEIERHKAVSDLLYENSFTLQANPDAKGPYHLVLSLQEERLMLQVHCTHTGYQEEIGIPLGPFRKHIQDYTLLCDSFYKTAREGQIHKLEALDAGRRSIHNESAEILAETLENRVILDKSTARRLFSLVYVLHIRSSTNLMR